MLWCSFIKIIVIALPFQLHEVVCNTIDDIVQSDPDYGVRWMFMPDGDGNPHIAYLTDPGPGVVQETQSFHPYRKSALDGVNYHLYRESFRNNPVTFKITDKSYQKLLNDLDIYDPALETKMIIHGWKNTYKSPVGQKIKDAYLSQEDMNVIIVDWSEMADDNLYFKSADSTRMVGKSNARLLDYLVSLGTFPEDVHIIGHSLGAQTAGFTGANMRSGKPGRITGLDPAMPGFTEPNKDNRLDQSDADFVDVIHTCAGVLGSNENLGHADFWPNGGKMAQPGCSSIMDIVGACSHGRSYEFFADSIENEIPFLAVPCDSYETYKKGKCKNGEAVEMGDGAPNEARGSYFLNTRPKRPYAIIWAINTIYAFRPKKKIKQSI